MQHIKEALFLFRSYPRLKAIAMRPVLWAGLVYLILGFVSYWLFFTPLAVRFESLGLGFLSTPLFVILWLVCLAVTFVAVASFLGQFWWDRLSLEVETILGSVPSNKPLARTTIAFDSVARLFLGIAFVILIPISGLLIPIVGPILIAGYASLIEYTAPSLLRRGFTVGRQQSRMLHLPGWMGLFAVGGIVTLIPFVNALALPLLITAGTVMVARSK